MITSVVDLCTTVYVLIDDLYRHHRAPYDHRPGPRALCSESEIFTLSLVSELMGRASVAVTSAPLTERRAAAACPQ